MALFQPKQATKTADSWTKGLQTEDNLFGNVAVIVFIIVQAMDGVLTYLGVHSWGPSIEANPIMSSTLAAIGVGPGLMAAKLFAISLGILLHLRRVHLVIAFLTAFYVAAAIVPWTVLLLTL
jgi:hypothetical protein